MYELLTGLDWRELDLLADQFPGLEQKLAVTAVAVGALLAVAVSHRGLRKRLAERTRPVYADVATTTLLVATVAVTSAVVIGVWGWAAPLSDAYAGAEIGDSVPMNAAQTVAIVLVTIIVWRVVRRTLWEVLGSATAVTDHQREVTDRISQVLIWSASFVVVLGVWIDDLSSLLVGAGVLGVVVGMAAKQTLGTILAGFVLMFSRPFEIGDWVQIEDDEGIVTDISIFNTRIESFDGEYVVVPNDVVSSTRVTNRSRRGRLRIEIEVGVDYDTDLDQAAELAEGAIEEVDQAMDVPSPQVVAKAFGDSAILLSVRFWIDKPSGRRRWQARTAAIGAIKRAFDEAGVEIPFPQRELSGRAETGGFRVGGGERLDDAPADETAGDRSAGIAETSAEDD